MTTYASLTKSVIFMEKVHHTSYAVESYQSNLGITISYRNKLSYNEHVDRVAKTITNNVIISTRCNPSSGMDKYHKAGNCRGGKFSRLKGKSV